MQQECTQSHLQHCLIEAKVLYIPSGVHKDKGVEWEMVAAIFEVSISLAGTTMVACYLAELQLPTDESHRIRNTGQKIPLGLSGLWVVT